MTSRAAGPYVLLAACTALTAAVAYTITNWLVVAIIIAMGAAAAAASLAWPERFGMRQ